MPVSSFIPFSSCPQCFPASRSFPMSQFFESGGNVLEFQLQHQSFQWIFKTERADRGWDNWMGHWLNGHEFEQAPGVGDRQGSLARCSPWVAKSQTWRSHWTEPMSVSHTQCSTGETQNQGHTCAGRVYSAVPKNSWNEIRQLYRLQVALSASVVVNLCSLVICISLECK